MTQFGWAELQTTCPPFAYFFVPVTIGLTVLIAIMETIYLRTKKTVYRDLAKFWGRLFLINFAVVSSRGLLRSFSLDWTGQFFKVCRGCFWGSAGR